MKCTYFLKIRIQDFLYILRNYTRSEKILIYWFFFIFPKSEWKRNRYVYFSFQKWRTIFEFFFLQSDVVLCTKYFFEREKIKKVCMILNPQLVLVIWCKIPIFYNFQILWKSNLFHRIWKNYVLSTLRFWLGKLNFVGFFQSWKNTTK